MESKKCFKCDQTKPLSEFYKHPQMSDGHVNKCKECNKKDVKKNYRKNIDYYKMYDKERNKKRWGYKTELSREWRRHNKDKYLACLKINNALRIGKVVKGVCVLCGKNTVHGHHHDYSKPLDVVWLCPKHHVWLHKALKTDLKSMEFYG